jgi:hypothetical protein
MSDGCSKHPVRFAVNTLFTFASDAVLIDSNIHRVYAPDMSITASETKRLIKAAGGPGEFRRLLGMDKKPGAKQRINNWRTRGIPPAVQLEHYDLIQNLRQRAEAERMERRRVAV